METFGYFNFGDFFFTSNRDFSLRCF